MLTLSPDQQAALNQILEWKRTAGMDSQLTLGGYAGTGKTTIMHAVQQALPNSRIAFLSLTGKAVNVLESKLAPDSWVQTIHSFLYIPVTDEDTGRIIDWKKKSVGNSDGQIPPFDLIINDEASMTSKELYEDLMVLGKPALFVGDHGQLPPVKSELNLMANPDIRLETIHRQAEDNPILKVAVRARKNGYVAPNEYSPTVQIMSQHNITDRVAELLMSGAPDLLVITASNEQRVRVNTEILLRQGRTHQSIVSPEPGDRLICLRNDRATGLYNGAQCTLERIHEEYANYLVADVRLDGQALSIPVEIAKYAFNVPKPEWPGPHSRGIPFDYGYCLTCHKAQGSEAPRVIVLGNGFGNQDMKRRWLYTAVTRAQKELYVLN